MTTSTLGLADIIRRHGAALLARQGAALTQAQRKALRDVAACRTAALGGQLWQCGACGLRHAVYHSCRNRHCPRCQAQSRARWLEQQQANLLPVEYFHVVFTLPEEVARVALVNPATIYGLLFQATRQTLIEVAADPKHLGALPGMLLVLHTWGQTLSHHPHLHCVVSGGGLSCDARGEVDEQPCWRSCRPGFFLPVKVLSRKFRGKFLALLREAFAAGRLLWQAWPDEAALARWLQPLYAKEWVVYAKEPFGGPQQVLKYLARYTHRVAISDSRLRELSEDGQVTFAYKDYRRPQVQRQMTLAAEEFLRRWLWHVLPRGFVKVRHYGLLANRCRQEYLAVCRRLLIGAKVPKPSPCEPIEAVREVERCCPHCGSSMQACLGEIAAEDGRKVRQACGDTS